ncbi:MAG TPA: phosphatase PAP2 family protein [Candidatus Krumholzibacteria bacterium]|nr:phosphatase PAP2 family protein [Candidatus Krumholzibacteria bacterium]
MASSPQVQRASMFRNIRSSEKFAQYPLIGLTMLLIGGLLFGVLAYNLVHHGPLLAWDVPLANRLHATALASPRWVDDIMIAGFYVGDQLLILIGAVLGIYFLHKRYWRELVMLCNCFGVSAILFWTLSYAFHRARPVFETPIWHMKVIPGFPSGHAIAVASSYGLLLYLFVPKMKSRAGKVWLITAVVFVSVYVLFSRLFVGDHFLTDIFAGLGVGLAWSGVSNTAVELLFRKRVEAPTRNGLAMPGPALITPSRE